MSKLCSYFFISKLHSRQEYHEQYQIHRELDKIFRYSRCAVCKKTAHSFFGEVCDAKSLVYIKCIQEIRIKSYITEKYNTSSCNCDPYVALKLFVVKKHLRAPETRFSATTAKKCFIFSKIMLYKGYSFIKVN